MSRVNFEDYDPERHLNPMGVDDAQRQRRLHAGNIVPYRVCFVHVAGFVFEFHSTTQIELCIDYYRKEHLPSSRLPVRTGDYGGDQSETQRWFERLPGELRAKRVREDVVAALEAALFRYAKEPGAVTGTPKPTTFLP